MSNDWLQTEEEKLRSLLAETDANARCYDGNSKTDESKTSISYRTIEPTNRSEVR
jgi:hypothetical protein